MYLKRFVTIATVCSAIIASSAQGEERHHPEQAQASGQSMSAPGKGTMMDMDRMQSQMQAMQQTMDSVSKTDDPDQRMQMMQKHMTQMHDMMGDMRGMMGPGMMMQGEKKGTMGSGPQGGMSMDDRQKMMERRMDMMQQMMEQMMAQMMAQQEWMQRGRKGDDRDRRE